MKTTYPQTMTPLRAQWATFANIDEYFVIPRIWADFVFSLYSPCTVLKIHEISFLSQKQNEFTSWLCRIIDNLILNY